MDTEYRAVVSARLREERGLLGYSQVKIAEMCGSKPRTYQDWERGISPVPSDSLASLAKLGMDVAYVLTGIRSSSQQYTQELVKETDTLSREERALVDNYRGASETGKLAARAMLVAVAESLPVEVDGRSNGGKKSAAGGQ